MFFLHNINIASPIAKYEYLGDFKPNQEKAQKLRVWFGKQGDMALVSHLDLVRLFDRAIVEESEIITINPFLERFKEIQC